MEHLWQVKYSFLIPMLPLIGAAVAGFFGARWLKGKSHWPIWIGVGASAVISISLLVAMLGIWGSAVDPHTDGHKVGADYAGAPMEGNHGTQISPGKYVAIIHHECIVEEVL